MLRSALPFLAALLLLPGPIRSQQPLSTRQEFILPTPGLGTANAIVELAGGGFAAVGYADAGGDLGTDVFLVVFDSAGDTLWTRFYGGDREDFGWDIVESEDGSFFIVGYTEAPSEGREDVLVLRIDSLGVPMWERTFGGPGRDRAWSAVLADDGDIVIAAESESVESRERDAYMLRIGGDGEERWVRRISDPGDQRVYSVARTDDGSFVSTGTTATEEGTNRDVYVTRVDSDGRLEWSRSFGGEPDDVGHGVTALEGGAVLVTGYGGTRSHGGSDVYLLRINSAGEVEWWKHEGGSASERAMMSALSPRGYISVGYVMRSVGWDVMVWEHDRDGNVRATTTLERPGRDRGVMILETGAGEYVLAGTLGGRSGSSTGDFAVLWLGR